MSESVAERRWRRFDYALPSLSLFMLPVLMTFFWFRIEIIGILDCLLLLAVPEGGLLLLVAAVMRFLRDKKDEELKKKRLWWTRTASFCISPVLLYASLHLTTSWEKILQSLEVREGQVNEKTIQNFYDSHGRLPTIKEFSKTKVQRFGRWEYEPLLSKDRDGFVLEAELLGGSFHVNQVGRVPQSFNRMSGDTLALNWTYGMRVSSWREHLNKKADKPDQS